MTTPTNSARRQGVEGALPRRTEKPARRNDRFQARLSTIQRDLLEEAAILEGRTLSDFVVSHAQEAAQRTIRDHKLLALSERDAHAFAEAFLSPWTPTEDVTEDIRRMRALFDGE
jgi:uncharacterized protein (DUF1778 family)